MRFRSRRLGRDEVLRTAPVVGELRLSGMSAARPSELIAGVAPPGEPRWLLPPLLKARVTRIRGTHMVIVGQEQVETARALETHLQAWWVWLAPPPNSGSAPGPGPDRRRSGAHVPDHPPETAEVA